MAPHLLERAGFDMTKTTTKNVIHLFECDGKFNSETQNPWRYTSKPSVSEDLAFMRKHIVDWQDLEDEDAICFVIQPKTKKERFETQDWQVLENNPAYETLLKYKDSVFTETLRFEKSKERRIEHEIELEDKTPFSVKQFRLSPDQLTLAGTLSVHI